MKEARRYVTSPATPKAKLASSLPPAAPPIVEEEPDADKTHPMPEDWFKTRDQLYGAPSTS